MPDFDDVALEDAMCAGYEEEFDDGMPTGPVTGCDDGEWEEIDAGDALDIEYDR